MEDDLEAGGGPAQPRAAGGRRRQCRRLPGEPPVDAGWPVDVGRLDQAPVSRSTVEPASQVGGQRKRGLAGERRGRCGLVDDAAITDHSAVRRDRYVVLDGSERSEEAGCEVPQLIWRRESRRLHDADLLLEERLTASVDREDGRRPVVGDVDAEGVAQERRGDTLSLGSLDREEDRVLGHGQVAEAEVKPRRDDCGEDDQELHEHVTNCIDPSGSARVWLMSRS
jgi:hypothetical protein